MDKIINKLIFNELEEKANNGNPVAQACLGFLYEGEFGFEQNYEKSLSWYEKAASQGITFAQHNLGALYKYGNGVEINIKKAAEYYLKAAEQGDADAQYCLFYYYAFIDNQHYDREKFWESMVTAAEWCKKAADQNYLYAQITLVFLYKKGWGVKRSPKMSSELRQKIEIKGKEPFMSNAYIDGLIKEKTCLFRGYNYHKSAEELYKYVKTQNDKDIITCFEYLYNQNKKIEVNYSKIYMWCKNLAEQGDAPAQTELGYMYFSAKGTEYNFTEALKWWETAAEKGEPAANFFLSLVYKNGDGVDQNETTARAYWEKAKALLSDSDIFYYSDKYYKKNNKM